MKPKRISKKQYDKIFLALHEKSMELADNALFKKAPFGTCSFLWHCHNYKMNENIIDCWHFKPTPCDWFDFKKGEECICLTITKDNKYYLDAHLTGECHWRDYSCQYR